MSADPPGNQKGTAAANARGSGSPTSRPGDRAAAEVSASFGELAGRSERWRLTPAQRRKLAPAVAAALATGWTPEGLAGFAGASTVGIRNLYAVLAARLSPAELPPPARARPPWCGRCDERTRLLGFDSDAPRPCPSCKPTVPAIRAGWSADRRMAAAVVR